MIGRGAMGNPWLFRELATGDATVLTSAILVQALLAFALINELSLKVPQKLAARLAAQRLGPPCGNDFERWQALGAQLSSLVCGVPRVYVPGQPAPELAVTPVVAARTKLLWRYLRESLPEDFRSPRLLRTKSLAELLNGIATAVAPDACFTPRLAHDA